MSQLSFFAADTTPPSLDDVEGLLAGPGSVVRQDSSARLGLVVSDPARIAPLVAAFAAIGLEASTTELEDGRVAVRSAFTPELAPVADRWLSGAVKRPPAGFVLDGRRLHWWCLAAGHVEPSGYVLPLGDHDEESWQGVGAALSVAGLPATLLGPRGGGPAFRVSGAKRLRRLRELVGDPPDGVPPGLWPPT